MRPSSRRALLASLASFGAASGCFGPGGDFTATETDRRTSTDVSTLTPTRNEAPTDTFTRTDTPTETSTESPREDRCDRQWQPTVRWSLRTDTRAYPPTVVDGVVYFGSQDGYLYAVNADDGTIVWRTEHGGGSWNVPPAVADGVVTYADSNKGVAYDADSGRERWSFEPPGERGSLTREFGDDGATVYFGASNHSSPSIGVEQPYDRLYAFDRRSGERRWENTLTASHDEYFVPSAVTVGSGRVVANMGENGALVAYDARDGHELWRRSHDESRGRPIVVGETVYQYFDRSLVALDAATGQTRWAARGSPPPAVADGTVYVADGDVLRARAASGGEVRWAARIPGGPGGSPARADDTVYVSGSEEESGRLYAFDASTGCLLGGFTVRSAGPTVPAVAGDTVYVGGQNGEARMWAVSAPR